MKQLSEQQPGISLSHGAVLPNSILATTNLSDIIVRAASYNTGITYCGYAEGDTSYQSYGDLLHQARCILGSLRDRGLQPQNKVILQLEDPRYFFACLWGCFLGGFVPIPLGVERVEVDFEQSKLYRVRQSFTSDRTLIISDTGKIEAALQVEDLLKREPDNNYHYGKLDDLALLLFTSGSTGKPKGVMLSVRNLIASIYGMTKVNQLGDRDITLNWMPLEHVASLVMFHLSEVYLGCQQIQVQSELILQNPLQWLDLIDRHRVTVTWSPNFAYSLVNDKLNSASRSSWDLSCVRWMGNGAEAVVGQTSQRFLELLAPYGLSPAVLSPGYGMSETTSGICHSNDFYRNMNREFVEVGAPIPGVSLRIVDEYGDLVLEGEIGLLQVKGATVTAGYYQQPELNREVFTADGWFNTGDLGFLNAGKLTITGRQKDVIIVNGVNYYSHEIETVVEAIAGVTVSYTAACSVNSQQQQVAIFFHTLKQEELRELINKIRHSVFTSIGVAPAYIIPVAKETIPKTAIGKIQRSQLSQRFAAGEFDEILKQVEDLFNSRNLTKQDLPHNAIEQKLVAIWQEVLNLKTVGVNDSFFELGGNSLLLMQALSKLTPEYNLSATALFQYPTISALANYLNSDRDSKALQQGKCRGELRKTGNKDVAIIGMSCRFPGANNISEFWDNLCNGVESISFFEDAEILASGVESELLEDPNYVKASPILKDIQGFDADFWGYSPKEAQLLDPQQRLFLECAWESLEDAGYDPFNYQGDISLYGGAATNTYLLNNIYPNRHTIDDRDRLRVINLSSMGGFQVTTANDKDYLTTRTSYKLNLTGSSVNVQTACSTSLVTVHLACQSLINSECDLALAGGVSVHSPQKMGYLHQEGMILSADGHCRAFDRDASGTIFGSGAGMVVLKLLDKAIEDGDRIYGVIKGSAVNNDGGIKVGYFAPNVDGQTRVVAEALAVGDLPPESISYIEAHGTGTKLGDPIEITALTQAYQQDKKDMSYCAVGSVKTNVGHLQMASGIVGLIKATLCLYHQKIVPSLHYTKPNPQIDLEHSPFYINTQLQEWTAGSYPRRAGVNSLGIGGTNAHVILEEFIAKKIERSQLPAYLLTLSAKTAAALEDLKQSYADYLSSSDVELSDICLTSNIGRHHFDRRVGIVATNKFELAHKLQQTSTANLIQSNKIAFLFTGQGSQYVGMGQQLYNTQFVFRNNCDRCFEILQSYTDTNIAGAINQSPLQRWEFDLDRTEYTQPLLFTIEYALAQMWLSWGVEPDVVMGHSIGEYVAATIAGVFSLSDALKLVVNRGMLMQSLPENGGMLAVFSDLEEIDLASDKISVAANNGSHIVLSGWQDEIDRVAKELELQGIRTQRLNVSHAFHSALMQPMVEEFAAVARSISYSLPQIPIVSNLTGELADKTIATADYWVEHILQPVQFAKSIEYLDCQQVDIFLEIGTKPTLTGMAKSILDNKLFLHSLDRQQSDWRQILTTLSQLYTAGFDINWLEVTKDYNANKTSLPTYPWKRQRYWFDIPLTTQFYKSDRHLDTIHPLVEKIVPTPLKQIIFDSNIQLDAINWLQDHVVNDKVIFPGTAYLEMAIASGIYHYKTDRLIIEDVAIELPLYLDKSKTLQLILDPITATWQIYSLDSGEWQLHFSGKVSVLDRTIEEIALAEIKAEFYNHELDTAEHYQNCQQRGVNYGKSFQGIKQLWAKGDRALGLIELPNNLDSSQYYFHPALLDSCLQILFAATTEPNTTYIPVGLDRLEIYSLPEDRVWSYLQIRQQSIQNKIILADVWLHNANGKVIAKLEGLKSQAINSQPDWHDWLYQQEWIHQPVTTKALSKNGSWLIFADSKGIGKRLATVLKSQQQRCHLVKYNPVFDRPQAFQDLLKQHSEVTGIIYLWSLDSVDNWEECKSYLYLVQAVIKLSHNPYLCLVTRNAQPVDNYQLTSGIRHSCLWGMQKAIALEHPELLCVGIDLDPNSTDSEANLIFEEICAGENEQAAYRGDRRYVSRLVRYDGETRRLGDKETGRQGDWETGRLGDWETGRLGDWETERQSYSETNLQLEISNPGDIDSLEWKTVSRRQPLDNEIEIEIKATGLNFRDVMVALDLYPDETKFLGLECAGVVTAIGKQVTNFQIGDEVIAIAPFSFSKYITVNSLLAISKPESFTFTEAATIPVTFLTAYYTLSHLAQLQPGEKVLIHAAAGGVGLAAIQIAQQLGAQVWATASEGKWELLRSIGVTKIMNSRSLDFAEEIMSATEGKGVDVVLNSLSGEFISKSLSVLNEHGRFIEIGKQSIWSRSDVSQVKPNIGYFIVDLWQITQKQPELIQQMIMQLRSQFITGKLKPLPNTVFKCDWTTPTLRDRTIDAFRYMQQGKHRGKIVISNNTQTKNTQFTPTGTYLITGGMGAIGLEVAQWLTTKGVTDIILLGRNGVKPELQTKLQKLIQNANLTLIKADISSTSQLAQSLLQIESSLPPLRGVIHCAGVLDDGVIADRDWNSFTKVLAPKVQGAWNLHELTQKYDLESFILFSSASSLLGSAGQANYCAANAFLDALAHARRSQGLPAIAINWGVWQDTGLASDIQTINSLKQKGVDAIEPSQAIDILEQLLSDSPAQIGVIPIDWERYNNPVTSFDRYPIHSQAFVTKTDLKQQLVSADPSQRLERAIAQISQQVGNILGIEKIEEIDLDLGFSELGLDSLASVELRNKVQSSYDLKLSATAIFDYSSIKALANYLLTLIFETDIASETTKNETDSLFNRVENLTDEEAETLLLNELKDFDF